MWTKTQAPRTESATAREPRARRLGLGSFGVLTVIACAAPPLAAPAPVTAPPSAAADLPPLGGVSAEAPPLGARRRVGDWLVHHFHGSHKKQLLTLTEEVVALEGDLLVVDYELSEGERRDKLRVRLSARSERLISVSRWEGTEEVPAEIADYEALLARTSFVPDQNAGRVAESSETCLVGPAEFDCEVARYRVFVGDREASLTVKSSERAGRDISGEVVALDGTVLYRAELVEMKRGSEAPRAPDASAHLGTRDFDARK